MGSITSLKCVLTQEHLDAICTKYFVLEEVHPQLPSPDATMHERPTGKVGMYTRLFDYANYRIPFSTFFVSVLTHFRIPFSQLSVFGSAKGFPANAYFSWFSGSNIVKDRAPAPSEYNVEHVNTLIAQASPFLRFLEEFLCWVVISRNYLLNKDTYPRFVYENGEGMDLNAFIRTADPRKVRIVKRPRAKNERPIVTVAKHRTVTLLSTSVVHSFREFSASVEREFAGDASVGDGRDQVFDSVAGQDTVEPSVPATEPVKLKILGPSVSKKRSGSVTGGKSPSVLNRLLQDSRLTVEQGVSALPTLPFITSSVTASPFWRSGGRDRAKSADPEVDSLARSAAPVMTEATTVATVATTVAILTDVSKDKSAPHPSVFGSSSSSEKTDRTLSLFAGRSGSGFDAGSIRAEEAVGAGSEEIYVPEWTVTRGFELNDGHLCANMIDHFTPPAFFKTVRGMEHEQLFTEFNVSAARNLSLSSEVRMRAEYNILEKRKWRSLAEEKNVLLEVKDKEIEDLKSQLLKAREESAEVTQLRAQVSGLEATEDSLRGEVASQRHNVPSEQDFHPHLLNVVAGRRWLLTHGMKLLLVKCLNSNEYMEALGHAFGHAIKKGMHEGLAAGIEHGQAGRCLTDLEAYIPSAEDDFNSAIRNLRDLNFPLLLELSNKKDANTWDIMDLLCLDDVVAEALACLCRLFVYLPALIEPSAEVPATNVLSTVVIVPPTDPSVSVEDYENPDSTDVVSEKNAYPGSEAIGKRKIDASAGGWLTSPIMMTRLGMMSYECICYSSAVACDLAVLSCNLRYHDYL
ncbi:hypothetical protein Tco_0054082 [Tanacetum coccineum]